MKKKNEIIMIIKIMLDVGTYSNDNEIHSVCIIDKRFQNQFRNTSLQR